MRVSFLLFMIRVCYAVFAVHCSLVGICWERANLLALFCVMFSCVFVTFPCGVLSQVWYLIASIPDLCSFLTFLTTWLAGPHLDKPSHFHSPFNHPKFTWLSFKHPESNSILWSHLSAFAINNTGWSQFVTLILPSRHTLPLKRQEKIHLKMLSAEVVCCKWLSNITDKLSIEVNSVDPEQTAPIGAVWSGSTLFAIEPS